MGISVRNLLKTYGQHAAIRGISFDVAEGEFVTLLGPSGCGKTTTLRAIAGLDVPDGGTIAINDTTVSDAASGVFVPPHGRDLGMVFQSYAIWPHLTVAQNVAFPLTVRGVRDSKAAVDWALEIVGLSKLADRRPSELSGGQQQRVALARAIAGRPQVLLFDEPLSNLDARLRDRTRGEISRIQRELGVPALYVTHDQTEALSMSDRVIIMRDGAIAQQGTPRALYHAPASRFVADFIGSANFLDLRRDGSRWVLADGTPVSVDPASDAAASGAGVALLRPEAIRLHPQAGAGGATGDNRLSGQVVSGMYMGPHIEYLVDAAGERLRVFSRHDLPPGSPAVLEFAASDCRLVGEDGSEARHAG